MASTSMWVRYGKAVKAVYEANSKPINTEPKSKQTQSPLPGGRGAMETP